MNIYSITNDLIYNPLKSVCIVFKLVALCYIAQLYPIGDECLKYGFTFKYLVFVFSENKKDYAELLQKI